MNGTDKPLVDRFFEYVANMIDETGVFPHPGMALQDDGALTIAALMDETSAYSWFWDQVRNRNEVVMGMDRYTRPGQGTVFADVLTCCHWSPASKQTRVGVINYQHEPRIVRPWDWGNQFWSERVLKELGWHEPPVLATG